MFYPVSSTSSGLIFLQNLIFFFKPSEVRNPRKKKKMLPRRVEVWE